MPKGRAGGHSDCCPLEGGSVVGGEGISRWERERRDGRWVGTVEGADLGPGTWTIGAGGTHPPVERDVGRQAGGRGVAGHVGGTGQCYQSELVVLGDLDGVAGSIGDIVPFEGGAQAGDIR